MSIPPPAPSNPVSDREEGPEDDEDGSGVEDSEILADLPDDTDVRRFPPLRTDEKHVIADPVSLMWFIRVPRRSTSCIRE